MSLLDWGYESLVNLAERCRCADNSVGESPARGFGVGHKRSCEQAEEDVMGT